MKYSPSARGFFHEFSANMPWDAVSIPDDEYAALIQGQSAGKMIVHDSGKPVLADRPAETWLDLRVVRNSKLSDTDWTQLPDAPASKKEAWAAYRQQLRDLPQTYPDPAAIVWPSEP